MDTETKAAFERIDRWFELMQAQHVEQHAEVNGRLSRLETDLRQVCAELRQLRAEFRQFRDWTTAQFSDLRAQIAQLFRRFEAFGR